MKVFYIVLLALLLTSCNWRGSEDENIVDENPYLIGTWEGQGRLMDTDVTDKIGDIQISIMIESDQNITLSVGNVIAENVKIENANYGFGIFGELNTEISKAYPLEKSHVIILLVLPKENRDKTDLSLANFHLKTNYFFDFNMRVGGVALEKK